MRHGNKINALGRKRPHRRAMLANMACSLIEHKRINTTVAKAKELRKYVEPLLTKSKTDSTHSRRTVFSYLKQKEAVTELFREVAPKIADRPGGYLRIIKTGRRLGDSAEMCMVELVDFNELLLQSKPAKAKRSRRGGKKKSDDATSAAPEAKAAAPAPEVAEEKKADAAPGAAAEVKEETPAPEAKVEETKAEAAPEAKAEEAAPAPEAKAEAPAPEAEAKVEEPAKEEAAPEAKAEEPAKKEAAPEAKSEEGRADEKAGDETDEEKKKDE
jgi:large subunit ribosomal protein L17